MNILILGDIVGRPGRRAVAHLLPALVAERKIDFVVANAENVCDGSGITPALFDKLSGSGVDAVTMGDHAFRRKESYDLYRVGERIVRPGNLPTDAVGRGITVVAARNGVKVAIASLMGQLHMKPSCDSPFTAADRLLRGVPDDVKVRVVDIHAEVTAEKVALGRYLDGRVTAVVGTHTHVPTADEQVLPAGTAYITDLGMTGPYDSVLGRRADRVVRSLATGMPQAYDVADGDVRISGVLVRADPRTGRAQHIERVQVRDTTPAGDGETSR
jgi:hypothetical protein